MTKKATIELYRMKLAENAAWALRGLVRIYEEQTEDERDIEATTEHNGVGFTGVDGEILTSFAKQYLRKGSLTKKQMKLLHKKMPKYAKQLYTLSNEGERKETKMEEVNGMPKSMRCACNATVELEAFTNTCRCGRDYNFAGQLLADRSQWGEETGETWDAGDRGYADPDWALSYDYDY